MPKGPWVLAQRWHDLVFAHWRCDPDAIRPLVPAPLELDIRQGECWIGVVPFRMRGVRLRAMPPIPTVHDFLELNVRTYVVRDGIPGVWFFSLDAASPLAVTTARALLSLPYFHARMSMTRTSARALRYESTRTHVGAPHARFLATYRPVGLPWPSSRGSLAWWLTERYCLYAVDRAGRTWRTDIGHAPWMLQDAEMTIEHNSMIDAAGVRVREGAPLLHYSGFQDVRTWRPVRVG